jgi:hypothetical protein
MTVIRSRDELGRRMRAIARIAAGCRAASADEERRASPARDPQRITNMVAVLAVALTLYMLVACLRWDDRYVSAGREQARPIARVAKTNAYYAFFAIQLVERFVSEKGRWPHSWGELEGVPMHEGPFGLEWPACSPEVRRRIFIDFGADPHDVARQAPMSFTAIRPTGRYVEYRDFGHVQALQQAIRKSLRASDDGPSRAPVDVSSGP